MRIIQAALKQCGRYHFLLCKIGFGFKLLSATVTKHEDFYLAFPMNRDVNLQRCTRQKPSIIPQTFSGPQLLTPDGTMKVIGTCGLLGG